jgi:helicase
MIDTWLSASAPDSTSYPTFKFIEITERCAPDERLLKFIQEKILYAYRDQNFLIRNFQQKTPDVIKNYIEKNVIPADINNFDKSVREGDFGEIVSSLIVGEIQHREAFTKLRWKINKDKSVFGTDIVAFDSMNDPSKVYYYEVKTRYDAMKKESPGKGEPSECITVIANKSLQYDISMNENILDFMAREYNAHGQYDKADKFLDYVLHPESIEKAFEIFILTDSSIYNKNYAMLLQMLDDVQNKETPLSITFVFIDNMKQFVDDIWSTIIDNSVEILTKFTVKLASSVKSVREEGLLQNYKSQLLAAKLHSDTRLTYKLDYIWNKILYLITGSCFLLEYDVQNKEALLSLQLCAELCENISSIEDGRKTFDPPYMKIISALCYDIAGYQANAYCMVKGLSEYKFESIDEDIDVTQDNLVIQQIVLILQNKIPLANQLVNLWRDDKKPSAFRVTKEALLLWYDCILNVRNTDYLPKLHEAYTCYLSEGNIYISQIILLLEMRIKLFDERSIYKKLYENDEVRNNQIWKKYLKLLANDTYSKNGVTELKDRHSIFEFWISQIRALDDGLLKKDENFVVQMPTSAGKTFIAELYLLKYLIKVPGKKVLYVSPFRALSSEKVVELGRYFSKIGYSVSQLSGSYETDTDFEAIYSESDILVLTPEKADLFLRTNPDFFNNVSCIVFDEGHIVGEISTRASLTEFLIIRLKIKYPHIRLLFISAVMPRINAQEYAQWLSNNENNILRSRLFADDTDKEWEPTRKNIGYFTWSSSGHGNIYFSNIRTENEETHTKQPAFLPDYLKPDMFGQNFPIYNNKPSTAAALAYAMVDSGCTLVFCGEEKFISAVANRFIAFIKDSGDNLKEQFKTNNNTKSFYYAKEWYGENSYITKSIQHGIGIHFGDLAEQVRNAVEDDYKAGILCVLLCTNTVGQGINFPIKNLIIYQPIIGYSGSPVYISHSDLLNIIGRSGRAGVETEGTIVYILDPKKPRDDLNRFRNYLDKSQIEPENSFVYRVLSFFLAGRISEESCFKDIALLIETYILDLVTEETIINNEELINKIINNSLFKIQAENEKKPLDKVHEAINKVFSKITEDNQLNDIAAFSKTGLYVETNKQFISFISANEATIQASIDNGEYEGMLDLFLNCISENNVFEIADNDKLSKIEPQNNWVNYSQTIKSWINGEPIETVKNNWNSINGIKKDNIYKFISTGLYYLFPWLMTSFVTLISYKLNIEYQDLPENIRALPSFIKYGLNSKTACIARSEGIKSRSTALFLAQEANTDDGKKFISWLANLDKNEIDTFAVSEFEKENIYDVVRQIIPGSNRAQPTNFQFEIKGTKYHENMKEESKRISIGEQLDFERDEENEYDAFAIRICNKGIPIGYVPSEYSKYIATEMDLNQTKYLITVIGLESSSDLSYNVVQIKAEKISETRDFEI